MAINYTRKQIFEFLSSTSIMSTAVCGKDCPISSVVVFSIDSEFTFYFATKKGTYKDRALGESSKISMSIWEHKKMLVQASGVAELLKDANEIDVAMEMIISSLENIADFWPPILRLGGEEYAVYRIKWNWMRALDLSSSLVKESEPPFTEVEV